MMTPAQRIAAYLADNAYMAYTFSFGTYQRMATFLMGKGFTPAEAECLLNSKHVRWSYDSTGKSTSISFKHYFDEHEDKIRRDVKSWGDAVAWHQRRHEEATRDCPS